MPQRRRFHRSGRRDAGAQVAAMKARFPGFTCRRIQANQYVFEGSFQPTEQSRVYHLRVSFTVGRVPVARVMDPPLHEAAPHLWEDGSLCLFHPTCFDWNDRCLVVSYTMPWVAMWLYFYEKWLDLGVWLGPEAPHS